MRQTTARFMRVLCCGLAALALAAGLTACGGGSDDAVVLTPSGPLDALVCQTTSGHTDGDTFKCTTFAETFTVRLSAVDAPESNQSFGEAARQALQSFTPAGTLVACYKTDGYGRRICRVYTPQGLDVQALMLEDGMAWHYTAFAHEQTDDEYDDYVRRTGYAQLMRIGLWSQSNPQAPWECRSTRICW